MSTTDFSVQLYEQRAQNFTVTTNGVRHFSHPLTLNPQADFPPQLFSVGFADIADEIINTELYAAALPPALSASSGKTSSPAPPPLKGSITRPISTAAASTTSSRLNTSSALIRTQAVLPPSTPIYHAILVYDSDAAGFIELYYFSDGDGGAGETIGAQGFDTNHLPQAVTYEYNTPNTVAAGTKIDLGTDLNDNPNGTVLLRSFQVACYPPGTFPVGTC